MKKSYALIILISSFFYFDLSAQPGSWTWLHGTNSTGSNGNFGLQGLPSPSNEPPAMYESAEFTDSSGNFWLFGGLGTGYNDYGDLWKYDPVSNLWVWMKGTSLVNNPGSFGVQGVPAATNFPSARSWGVASWVDNNGDFWIYGGYASNGVMSDLWKYEVSSNTWTWMQGSSSPGIAPVYGTMFIPNAANTPGSRYECNATWVDTSNNLWLFGGYNQANSLNDLWKYNLQTNEWTWMSGANMPGQPAVYGTLGIPNTTNVPGAREVYCHWKDANENFWVFGGSLNLVDFYNDMWMYNPTTNTWTWMSGTNLPNDPGHYGIQCIPSSSNMPPARFENRAFWTDNNGNFWLYGGSNGGSFQTGYGDLWMFNPVSLEWAFVSGDTVANQSPLYGTLGVPSVLNKPGSRSGAISWIDSANNLFLYGGTVNGWPTPGNDLWKYEMDPNCPVTVSSAPSCNFLSSDTTFCGKKCLDFTDLSTNSPTSWQWFFPGADSTLSSLQNPVNICYNSYGNFDVTLIACNANGCDTLFIPAFIREFQSPATPVVTGNADTLFSTHAYSYQWYFNSTAIPGATDSLYVVQQQGGYYVIITDSNGCASSSNAVYTSVEELEQDPATIRILPNPNNGLFEITWMGSSSAIEITDILGRSLFHSIMHGSLTINLPDAANGIYFLRMKHNDITINKKIMIQH